MIDLVLLSDFGAALAQVDRTGEGTGLLSIQTAPNTTRSGVVLSSESALAGSVPVTELSKAASAT